VKRYRKAVLGRRVSQKGEAMGEEASILSEKQ